MTTSRILGLMLIAGGVVLCLLSAAVSLTSAQTTGGRVLGAVLGALLGIPLMAIGAFILIRSQQEARELAVVQQQKKLLGMVRAQGRVNIAEAALELRVSRDTIKEWVYDLVHKGLFTGYINWDQGDLISADAAQMRTNKCPHCGGELELAGKGVVHCPYCGTEIFL
ncbi:MAG: zinc ribbon domain-containing protein [Anaerolineae bacterium]|nr:zinc ribbon domain-containing protein [Anaerolineae bacterium]MDW8067461.1 zinc ribbon domain-containing protein [Anaerolineae bacterium]